MWQPYGKPWRAWARPADRVLMFVFVFEWAAKGSCKAGGALDCKLLGDQPPSIYDFCWRPPGPSSHLRYRKVPEGFAASIVQTWMKGGWGGEGSTSKRKEVGK